LVVANTEKSPVLLPAVARVLEELQAAWAAAADAEAH
jgi:flagellin-specific chaperone FliS